MYTKISGNGKTVLSYIESDFYYTNKLGLGNGFQRCEPKEQYNLFERVLYSFNGKEGIVKYYLVIDFDFKNSTVTVNGKKMNVESSFEYTFKKTRGNNILAIGGIEGFYKTVVDFLHPDSAFNIWFLGCLENLFNTVRTEPKIEILTLSN